MPDFIPPLPSLWAVVFAVVAFVLWRIDRPILAGLAGVAAVIGLLGWIASLVSWAFGLGLILVVAFVAFLVAKHFVGKMKPANRKAKKQKDTLNAGETKVETLLKDLEQQNKVKVPRQGQA